MRPVYRSAPIPCNSLLFLGFSLLLINSAWGQVDVGEFYRGKRLTVVIGQPAGGGIDVLIRTVVRHLVDHIPGSPSMLVQNMPGAGTRIAANWLYNLAPKDGSFIGNISQNAPGEQALGEDGVQYDVRQFQWIGNPQAINNITLSWAPSGLRTIDDVRAKGGLICGGNQGSPSSINPQILSHLLEGKVKVILGYPGNAEAGLAMQKGELNCLGASSLPSSRVMFGSLVADRTYSILVQWGVKKDPAISEAAGRDVPLVDELARDDRDRRALEFINANVDFGRPVLAPPGTPPERVAALRRAFEATMRDPRFLADAHQQKLDVAPVTGETLQDLSVKVAATSPATLQTVKALMGPYELSPK